MIVDELKIVSDFSVASHRLVGDCDYHSILKTELISQEKHFSPRDQLPS